MFLHYLSNWCAVTYQLAVWNDSSDWRTRKVKKKKNGQKKKEKKNGHMENPSMELVYMVLEMLSFQSSQT